MKKLLLILAILTFMLSCNGQERSHIMPKVNDSIQLDEGFIFKERYVHIIDKKSKKKGLYDYLENKIVIPIQYEFIYKNENYWVVYNEVNEYGKKILSVYDSSFKQILPLEFDKIKVIRNYIYTEKGEIKDIYNPQGKNLTEGKFQEIIDGFSDGLQLVKKEIDGNLDTRSFVFIDSLGNTKLSYSGKYYNEVRPFCYGRAMVFKYKKDKEGYIIDSKIGYIDTEGKLVIPHIFESALDFFSKTTMVANKKNWLVINREGRTLKIFRKVDNDFPYFQKNNYNPNFPHIYFSENEVYNEYGERIKVINSEKNTNLSK